ncbi:MAG: hypothetical protein WDN00_12805 [Limisphaerales bacterium]
MIDPLNITIGNTGSGSAGSGTVPAVEIPPAGTLTLNVNSAFTGFSQIDLQARNNITVSALWDLVASTGISAPGSLLKLEAGNNITIGTGAGIVAGAGWSVTLQAGRNFAAAADTVTPGTGNINFSGTARWKRRTATINLLAGNNITVNAVMSARLAAAASLRAPCPGNINTGTKRNGYIFYETEYVVDPALGGISTANWGVMWLSSPERMSSAICRRWMKKNVDDGGFGGRQRGVWRGGGQCHHRRRWQCVRPLCRGQRHR